MKKSFFVGFLASLALADKVSKPSYSSSEQIRVQQINFPTATGFSSSSRGSVTASTNEALANAAFATGDNTAQSIDSLFLRLPSKAELDNLILGADSVAILKTIQTVATDDSLTCDQRISYLLEVLGRIRTAVEKKQFAADQLKVIIDAANAQIIRLQGQIDRLNKEIDNLWLDELHDNLAAAVAKLEDLYRQFNAVEANIAPNEAKIAGYQKQISVLTASSDAERNRIANDRLRLTEIESNIRSLESELADARNRESALNASIKKSTDAIARNDDRVRDLRDRIRALEDEIRRLRDEIDRTRAKYNDLEVKVERLRNDLAVANAKADRYRDQIRDLNARIAAQRKNTSTDDLEDLNEMIETLKKFIPRVQSEIDRHYYYCYGQGAVEVTQTGNTVVYIVRGERFGDYLRNQYGAGTVTNSLRQLGTLELRRVDIFSPVWSARYGYPFPSASLSGNGLNIAGSFSCVDQGAAIKGSGSIYAIGGGYIDVDGNNGRHRLHLGSCSRIESTSELPVIGQQIAYTAVASHADGYNLHQATCW